MTYQVDVLNPKADKLLQDLAALDLISIKPSTNQSFLKVVSKLRVKASGNPPSLADVTKEVELLRAKRYAKKKA